MPECKLYVDKYMRGTVTKGKFSGVSSDNLNFITAPIFNVSNSSLY